MSTFDWTRQLKGPPLPPELPEAALPRWPAWSAPVALISTIIVAIIAVFPILPVFLLAESDTGGGGVAATALLIAILVQDAVLVGAALMYAMITLKPRPWHFGLRSTPFWRAVGWLALVWFGFLLFSGIYSAVLGGFGIKPSPEDLPKELGVDESTAALIAVTILVCVVAPIAEEFFFRGYFFGALRNWRGVWPAAIITGLVFGAIHIGSSDIAFTVPLAFFGFVLCLLYDRTGSLYPCIALHALNNSIALGVTQDWDWQIAVVVVGSLASIAAILAPIGRRGPRTLPAS